MKLTTKFYCADCGITDTRCEHPEYKEGNPVRQVTEYVVTEYGTWYTADTDPEVMMVLDELIQDHVVRGPVPRVKIDFGDTETGKSWEEEFDTTGYVGRTIGPIKSPILLYNRRSIGGCIILANRILSIDYSNKKVGGNLYKWRKK